MAKHKSVTHLSAPAPSTPRLFAQLLTALGELVVAGVFILGLVTAGAWLLAGYDQYARMASRLDRTPPGQWLHCWRDRYGVEVCRPDDRGPPARRHYARDVF
jgi:hypothetical protein